MNPFGRTLGSLLPAILVATSFSSGVSAAEPSPSPDPRAIYARPFEPPTHPALIALPAGAVQPEGWLRDWCLAAKDGFTGHMDEYHVDFQHAWAADYTMTGERLAWPRGAWPYEGGGYWLDGLVRLGYLLHDDALIQQAQRRYGAVVSHMNSNSIVFLWWLNHNNPHDMKAINVDGGWPIWASGLLGRGMAAYYAASQDPKVLKALEMAYSGVADLKTLGWGGVSSNPWPAFDTYTWTGNPRIAAVLNTLFSPDKQGTGQQIQDPAIRFHRMPSPKPGAEKNEHVVVFLEATTPWALGYLWTGNPEFLRTAFAWHDLLVREAMQPSGVPVADEYYGPTGAYRGTETCDVAGYLWSQIFLLAISGRADLADRAERAFFNAGPATVSRDFKTHVYFQCPNRFADMSPPLPHGPQAEGTSYQRTHMPLCCTAALNRIVPNYVMHMWMATYDNGLAAAHYGPCKVSALVTDRVPVELTCRTDYPFNDEIEIRVNPARETAFPISFRIPGWCKAPSLSLNGTESKIDPTSKGFLRLDRSWKPGDVVRLRFPMSIQVETGHDRNAKDAPYAAVSYGPLLFALPIRDVDGPNKPDPAARWNYALDVPPDQQPAIRVERQPMPTRWDWPLASPLTLHAKAVACQWTPSPASPLPAAPVAAQSPAEDITLVPYGCTKFRVSMFPVTQRMLKQPGADEPR